MRILALTGDSDRSESALLAGLAQKGADVHCLGTPSEGLWTQLESAGVKVTPLNCISRIHPASIRMLRKKLSEDHFDLIHAFTSRMLSNALFASAGLEIKRVAYRGTEGHISKLDPAAWMSYLNPGVHRISCVSDAVRRYLLSCGFAEEKLVTIYKGHDVNWYAQPQKTDLSQFGIPPGAFTVACTANMRPVKGVDVLIQAASLLPDELNIHLLLIGEVRDSRILTLISNGKAPARIHLAGFRKDAPALVGAAQAFVMPSRKREGLPKAAIEAMSQCVPPIVTDVGGMPELVRNGIDGLVVPPSDPQSLAAAITQLCRDNELRMRLATQTKERIRDDFTVEQTVAKTMAMYEGLIGE